MNSDKVLAFAGRYGMFAPGDRVLCAVSGGADSVCLLHLLHGMAGISVVCAHFNHRLRGVESDRDEAFVRGLCSELGVECRTGSGDVAAYAEAHGMGTEEAARTLRYEFLDRAAAETGCRRIATAHNADDNAETVLMNLARGAGLRGLCGIPPVRGNIVRPLLETTREEILGYLSDNGLAHVEDSTNASDAYSRNRIRHFALPVLKEQNPRAVENIASACATLREDEAYLSSLADKFISENLSQSGLPAEGVAALPGPVMARVFRRMCGRALEAPHAEALRRLCLSDSQHALADVPGMRVAREYDRLVFGAAEARPIEPREIIPGTVCAVPESGLTVLCSEITHCSEINKTLNTFFFKCENICGTILLTSRFDGDRIELEGRKCTKTLKKLFSEAGMTLAERTATPVFRDDLGVIAVVGFGSAQRCAAAPGDDVIRVEVRKTAGEV